MLLYILIGSILGFFSGLIPIHQNTYFPFFVLIFSFLDPILLNSFLISFAFSQNFGNFILSYILFVPNDELALSTLPSQRLVKEKKAIEALKISFLFGILCLIIASILNILISNVLGYLRKSLTTIIPLFMTFALALLFYFEENKIKSFLIFLLSGIFGFICFNVLEFQKSIFSLLLGFFALPQLVVNLFQKTNILALQKDKKIEMNKNEFLKSLAIAVFGGIIAGILPAFGSSQIILLFQPFGLNDKMFIAANSGMMFSNEITSISMLYSIENPRSGLATYLKEINEKINFSMFLFFISVALLSSSISLFLALILYKKLFSIFQKINFRILNLSLIIFLLIATFLYSKLVGLLILFTSFSLGLLCVLIQTKRSYLMGSLILPTLFIYLYMV